MGRVLPLYLRSVRLNAAGRLAFLAVLAGSAGLGAAASSRVGALNGAGLATGVLYGWHYARWRSLWCNYSWTSNESEVHRATDVLLAAGVVLEEPADDLTSHPI